MLRISLLVGAVLVALGTVAVASASSSAVGRATLHQYNQSGIKGEIAFVDSGTTLTIEGTATGMNPNDFYVSLVYDNRSVAGGPFACEPAIFDSTDPDFILPTMFVGVWDVDSDGNGTLSETNIESDITGERVYVPLSKIKTMSIRAASVDFDRVACGAVAANPRI